MKNKILILLLAAMSSSAFAQIQKGAGYFGGQLYGYTTKGEDPADMLDNNSRSNNWSFNISYGHYLTDNLAIGLGAGMSTYDYKSETTGNNYYYTSKQVSTFYFIMPFVRLSKKIVDNFYCFGNLGLQVGTGTSENSYSSSSNPSQSNKFKQMNLGAGLTGGLNYFLNRHFAIALTYGNIYYTNVSSENDETDDKSTDNSFNINLGLSSVGIGLQYFINNGEKK